MHGGTGASYKIRLEPSCNTFPSQQERDDKNIRGNVLFQNKNIMRFMLYTCTCGFVSAATELRAPSTT